MKTVSIETSGKVGSVAVCDGDVVIAERSFERGMLHGKALVPSIKLIFDKKGLKPSEIDLIVVDVGPGSFTGVRVGIACAKTLSYVLNRPVIDVVSMDAIAQNVTVTGGVVDVCVVLDARRNRVYSSIYRVALGGELNCYNRWSRVSELLLVSVDELIGRLPQGTLVLGDGVLPYREFFENGDVLIDEESSDIVSASSVARLGNSYYMNGRRCNMDNLEPVYMQTKTRSD